ncbi:MAG: glycoside hydrolase family 88 protein [Lachnospiraceae bacterium]|nr:glycoside hydrolase family 88 protein [Lachnospiraceae bacterium]
MRELSAKIADKMTAIEKTQVNEDCPISIIDINKWEWAQGVGLYGLYRCYEVTGEERYLEYLKNWFASRIQEGLPEKNVNTCAPLLTLSYVYDGNQDYKAIMQEWAEWLMHGILRTEEQAFVHMVSGHTNDGQIWDDTLFMCVLFLARAGVIFERKDYLEETKRQFLVHLKYLTDKKTGLMYHGWTFFGRHNYSKALWGRGNCWLTVGIPDYIDIMGEYLEEGMKQYLLGCLAAQIEALSKCQEENGMWHTLLNEKESYEELSATAGFGYGIFKSVRKGYVDSYYLSCAQKALKAVIRCTDEDGTVQQVSYGTGLSDNLQDYREIPLCPMTYGQALAILCISEGERR